MCTFKVASPFLPLQNEAVIEPMASGSEMTQVA